MKIYVSKLTGPENSVGEATLRFLLNGRRVHTEFFSGMISGKHGGFYRNIKIDEYDTVEEVTAPGAQFEWEIV